MRNLTILSFFIVFFFNVSLAFASNVKTLRNTSIYQLVDGKMKPVVTVISGTMLISGKRNGSWIQVTHNGVTGWMVATHVTTADHERRESLRSHDLSGSSNNSSGSQNISLELSGQYLSPGWGLGFGGAGFYHLDGIPNHGLALGPQVSYFPFGGSGGSAAGVTANVSATLLNIFGIGRYYLPVGTDWIVFPEVGVGMLMSSVSVDSSVPGIVATSNSDSTSNMGLGFGGGVSMDISSGWKFNPSVRVILSNGESVTNFTAGFEVFF